MRKTLSKSLAFLIIWFASGTCFYFYEIGYNSEAYFIAILSSIAFHLMDYKQ